MKVVTFGELMIRLQPYNYERFVQADHLEFTFGGGEANVAVSLANYGLDAAYVTKLPAHAIGQAAVNSLRRYGVDTSMIVRGGDRVGIYFNEKGASQRGFCPGQFFSLGMLITVPEGGFPSVPCPFSLQSTQSRR